MRYLLDKLMSYEEGFTDILMKDRALDRHETFMGETPPAVFQPILGINSTDIVTHSQLNIFQENLLTNIRSLLTPHRSSSVTTTSCVAAQSSDRAGLYLSTASI